MIYFLIFIVTLVLVLHLVLNCNKDMMLIRKIPGSKEVILMGNFLQLVLKVEKFWIRKMTPVEMFKILRRYAKEHNGIYTIWAFGIKSVHIYNPDDIETLISTMKHSEKSITYAFLKSWLGDGLLLSTGPKWHRRRKILTGAFHFTILREFCGVLEENTRRFVKGLKKCSEEIINIGPPIGDFTLNSICETAMGTKLHKTHTDTAASYKEAIHRFGKLFINRLTDLLIFNFMLYLSPVGIKISKTVHVLKSFSRKVIQERKEQTDKYDRGINNEEDLHKRRKAMLDLLISAEKEGVIDTKGIQEEVDTFMFEGHDTSSSGLIYCFMLLANHKEVQIKVYKEVLEVFEDSSSLASIEDLSKLRYLECCIKESLRLYPPVPIIGRRLSEPTTLSNYVVPAGTHVHVDIYDLHRREDLFKNVEMFDPDRFLPENSIGRHPFAYIPFSAGPRNCIGQKLAMLEMKSCIAGVLREFELQPVTRPEQIEFSVDMVLRNDKPVLVKFVKRKQ